jgi:hypothetical protein
VRGQVPGSLVATSQSMTARATPTRRRARLSQRTLTVAAIFAVAAVALLIGPLPQDAAAQGMAPNLGTAASDATVTTQMTMDRHVTWGYAGPEFLGVAMLPTMKVNPLRSTELTATGISYVVWPSAKMNDYLDVLTNVGTRPDGSTFRPATSAATFVTWCKAVGCHAIIGLPGEINNSSFAVQEVKYFEKTLNFYPSFYEIGNEPGLWSHYNIPWSKWTATDKSPITELQYAELVDRYVTAIHAYDPTVPMLGLAGTGHGDNQETTWVYDTVKLNGPNLAGVAIHVYPISRNSGTLQAFDDALTARGSIARAAAADWQVMREACPTCHLQLIVTEFNVATVGKLGNSGTTATFMKGFPEVPVVAGLLAEGLQSNVANIDLYNLKSTFAGSIYANNGTPRPLFYLYADMLVHLDTRCVETEFTGNLGDFVGVACINHGRHMSLLLVNANPTTNIKVDLTGSRFPLDRSGVVYSYSSTMTVPLATPYVGSIPSTLTLPAESVFVVQVY